MLAIIALVLAAIVFSPWLLVAVAIVVFTKFRPRRSRQ